MKFYEETLTYNVAGKNHKKMHADLRWNGNSPEKTGVTVAEGLIKDEDSFTTVKV
jgi:hypothetical protein